MSTNLFFDIIKRSTLPCFGVIHPAGSGNKAARRAAKLPGYAQHRKWACEDIYTERPRPFLRASWLLANDLGRKNGIDIGPME